MRRLGLVVMFLAGGCASVSSSGSDAVASADGGESFGTDAAEPPPAKRIFVTESSYDGNLVAISGAADGLASADVLCAVAAQAALIGGTWKAWLSSSAVDAIDRIAEVGPWYDLTRTTLLFNNKAHMMTSPLAGIVSDEWGVGSGGSVWTGTTLGGLADPSNCSDWTATTASGLSGSAGAADSTWTESAIAWCYTPMRLYCVEQ